MSRGCCETNIYMAYSLKIYTEWLGENVGDKNVLIFAVLAFILITLGILFKFVFYASPKRDSILLIGLTDSGKTLLLSKLINHQGLQTITSQKENIAFYSSTKSNNTVKLIDIPGSDGIRQKFFDLYKNSARSYVFVVDSAALLKNIKDVAEYLYVILTDKIVHKVSPQIVVVCNKQDLLAAKSSKVVQLQLEKELSTLRKTQSAALTSIDESGEKEIYLGKKGEDFEFSHLGKLKVNFVECNAIAQNEDEYRIDELTSWIESQF